MSVTPERGILTGTAFWKQHYLQQYSDATLAASRKIDFSNDQVRNQTYGWLLEAMGPCAGLSCLDAGCGLGDVARLLDALGGRVDAFDVVEPCIEDLRRAHPQIR